MAWSTVKDEHDTGGTPPAPGANLLSWVLLMLGLVGFTPCVLVPEWLAYQRASIAEQEERLRLADMEHRVAKESARLEAIQADPEVVARLAQRELNFAPIGSVTVDVALSAESVDGRAARFLGPAERPNDGRSSPGSVLVAAPIEAPRPPEAVKRLLAFLPKYRYERVFGDSSSRLVILVMSLVVFCVALWLAEASRRSVARVGRRRG